jgi:hypothetical protein
MFSAWSILGRIFRPVGGCFFLPFFVCFAAIVQIKIWASTLVNLHLQLALAWQKHLLRPVLKSIWKYGQSKLNSFKLRAWNWCEVPDSFNYWYIFLIETTTLWCIYLACLLIFFINRRSNLNLMLDTQRRWNYGARAGWPDESVTNSPKMLPNTFLWKLRRSLNKEKIAKNV